jgi:hypothetical protein
MENATKKQSDIAAGGSQSESVSVIEMQNASEKRLPGRGVDF